MHVLSNVVSNRIYTAMCSTFPLVPRRRRPVTNPSEGNITLSIVPARIQTPNKTTPTPPTTNDNPSMHHHPMCPMMHQRGLRGRNQIPYQRWYFFWFCFCFYHFFVFKPCYANSFVVSVKCMKYYAAKSILFLTLTLCTFIFETWIDNHIKIWILHSSHQLLLKPETMSLKKGWQRICIWVFFCDILWHSL